MEKLWLYSNPQASELFWFSEIFWQRLEWNEKLLKIDDINNRELDTYFVSIPLPWNQCQSIKVVCNGNIFAEELEEKFNVSKEKGNNNEDFTVTFHNSWKKGNNYGYLWNKEAHIYWEGFWILKSAISSLSTYICKNSLPLHASVIHTDIWGIIFSGWNKQWKTTTAYNLFPLLSDAWLNPSIVCDDRCWVDEKGRIRTPDPTISVPKQGAECSKEIFDLLTSEQKRKNKNRKIALKVSNTPFNTNNIIESKIKSLFCLWDSVNHVGSFLVWSAYHYPYLTNQKVNHATIWHTLLREKNIPIYQYDTSKYSIANWCLEILNILNKL